MRFADLPFLTPQSRRGCLWLALLLGGISNAVAVADEVEVRLQLLPPTTHKWVSTPPDEIYDLLALRDPAFSDLEESLWQTRIFALLQKHHRPAKGDPEFLQDDMAQMALYFSRYLEVRALFEDLAEERWQWMYNLGAAETRVTGSRLQVDFALVLFDSRAGAQFRFQRACNQKVPLCYMTPADVLLHELLHVHGILRDTSTFLDQGGLNQHLYPYAHERQTITLERQLYAGMAQQDRIPRPQRTDHTGRRTSVSCVTCLR